MTRTFSSVVFSSLIGTVLGLACDFESVTNGVPTCHVRGTKHSFDEEHHLSYNGNVVIEASLSSLKNVVVEAPSGWIHLRSGSLVSAPEVFLIGQSVSVAGLSTVKSKGLVMYSAGRNGAVDVDNTSVVRAVSMFVGASHGVVHMQSAEVYSGNGVIMISEYSATGGSLKESPKGNINIAPLEPLNVGCHRAQLVDLAVEGGSVAVGSAKVTRHDSSSDAAVMGTSHSSDYSVRREHNPRRFDSFTATRAKVRVRLGDLGCSRGDMSCGVGVFVGRRSTWILNRFPHLPLRDLSRACFVDPNTTNCTAGNAAVGKDCKPCPVGTFSNDTRFCHACANAPKSGEYVVAGWNSSRCPYQCPHGVPYVDNNPSCLGPLDFAFSSVGGKNGLLMMAAAFLIMFFFLICRECMLRKRSQETQIPQASVSNKAMNSFSGEWLPFHVARVYIFGRNDFECPWGVDYKLPPELLPVVMMRNYTAFVDEANVALKVGRAERNIDRIFNALQFPLGPLYGDRKRKARARKLKLLVQWYNEGIKSRPLLWVPVPGNDYSMSFGMDDQATLGFFDFFDFHRDQLDWAPNTMLQQDGKVLVAGGHGTLNKPFTIDISSPIVQHLSHGLGAAAVYSVIYTFNRVSRHMTLQDVAQEPPSPLYSRLLQKVTKCAVQCGLADLVHVNRICIPAKVVKTNGSSVFSPLSHRDQSMNLQGRTFTVPATSYTHSSGWTQSASHINSLDVKLSLTFVDRGAADAENCSLPAPTSKRRNLLEAPPGAHLTSFEEHMSLEVSGREPSTSGFHERYRLQRGAVMSDSLVKFCSAVAQVCTSHTTQILLLLLCIFIDWLLAVMVTRMLHGYTVTMSLWFLCPPLSEVMCLVLGPLFVVTEVAELGRAYMGFLFSSVLQVLVTFLALCVLQRDTVIFLFSFLLIFVTVKVVLLFCCRNRIYYIHNRHDLTYMTWSQEKFLNDLFAPGGGGTMPLTFEAPSGSVRNNTFTSGQLLSYREQSLRTKNFAGGPF